MKKRIFSLLLVLIMVLSLALVSCKGNDEEPPPAPVVIPTEKFPVIFDEQEEQPFTQHTTSTNLSSLNRSGSYGGTYLYIGDEIYDVESKFYSQDFVLYCSQTGESYGWSIYTDISGESVFADDIYVDYDINSSYVYFYGEYNTHLVLEREDGTYDHFLFDQNMNLLVSESKQEDLYISISYSYGNNGVLYNLTFGDKIFKVERDGLRKTVTLLVDTSKKDVNIYALREFTYNEVTGTYIKISNGEITVLSSEYDLIFTKKFDMIENGDIEISRLNNGNYLVVYVYVLADDATEYEVFMYGEKANVTSFIYNPTDDSLTEIPDLKYIGEIIPVSEVKGFTDSTVSNLIFDGFSIENGARVREKNVIGLNDNLEIVKFFDYDELGFYSTLKNGAKIYENQFTRYIVDVSGNKVADLPMNIRYNEKWFYDDKAIYDTSLNVIYNYADAGRKIHSINPNSILFTEEEKDEETLQVENYVLWTGKDTEKLIGNDVDYNDNNLNFFNFGYYTKEFVEDTSTYTYKFYNLSGDLIDTVQNVNYLSDYFSSYGDRFVLYLDSAASLATGCLEYHVFFANPNY